MPTSATITLRQKSTLAFVTITNGATSASVTIDANSVTTGTYTLVLESYDSSTGSSSEMLNTDTVTVYVTEYVRSTSIASYLIIEKGSTWKFTVDDVSSSITLPYSVTPTINLRQKSTITFVYISSSYVSVYTSSASVTTGTYTLVLESYDYY